MRTLGKALVRNFTRRNSPKGRPKLMNTSQLVVAQIVTPAKSETKSIASSDALAYPPRKQKKPWKRNPSSWEEKSGLPGALASPCGGDSPKQYREFSRG